MFNNGDLVVYGNNGVCSVENVTTLDLMHSEKDKLYYVLKNVSSNGLAYVPVDSNVYMRPVMSKAEADQLIAQIPNVTTEQFEHMGTRDVQKAYHEALLSHNCEALISLIKHIRNSSQQKQLLKKKLSTTEERYLEQAQKIIDSELSAALKIEPEKLTDYITGIIGDGEK